MRQVLIIALALSVLISPTASAGDTENIKACAEIAHSAGATVDPYQVVYSPSYLNFSVAEWRGVRCEVKLAQVYNLTVNGNEVIYKGFRGRSAYELHVRLEREIDAAVKTLNTRAKLIESMKRSSEERLKSPNVDPSVIEREVQEHVRRALSTAPDQPVRANPISSQSQSTKQQNQHVSSTPSQDAACEEIAQDIFRAKALSELCPARQGAYLREALLYSIQMPEHCGSPSDRVYEKISVSITGGLKSDALRLGNEKFCGENSPYGG